MDALTKTLFLQLIGANDTPETVSRMATNLEYLAGVDPRFSSLSLKLLDNDSVANPVYYILHTWASDDPYIPAATNNVLALNEELGTNYTPATYILEEAVKRKSIEKIEPLQHGHPRKYRLGRNCTTGDKLVLKHLPELRPNFLEVSDDEVDRYYHPLAVGSSVVLPHRNPERFQQEIPEFIAWVSSHEDMTGPLTSALQTESIIPSHITDILKMRGTTPAPLHNGLL